VGGPASGVGALPGAGAGRPGVGAGGVGSGLGVRPGAGFGAPGVPRDYGYGYGHYGTYYPGWGAYPAQAAALAGMSYPYYNPAMYAGYPNAWAPVNMAGSSLYANPGYTATASQLGMAAQPAPYDYGSNVVVQPDGVYVNGDAAGTPAQYSDQANQIAGNGRSAQPDQDGKWLPLGVFAVVEGNATTSDDIFQLAVNPQGTIRGNYHNVKSNQVEKITGSVDKQSQRAAWTIGDDKTPVYEAGIANLTKDATPILVHLPDKQVHQVSLIRLPPPQQTEPGAGATSQP
jgi:hypothetical protein